jgi:PAS domain S-box-containing protein
MSGLLVGLGAALLSAPITAYVFGGVTGSGADYLLAHLAATGANVLQAATIQGFVSDPLDKMISFLIAWLVWRGLRSYFLPPSRRGTRPFESLEGYSVAVVVSLLALLLSFVFLPAFGSSIFSVFYLAVLISAWRGGLGPAVLTTAMGAFANILLLISPYHNVGVSPEDWLRAGIFAIVSLAIAAIARQLDRANRDLAASLAAEQEARARMRAITDGVDEAIALVAPNGRILEINRRFSELLGIPGDRIVGIDLEDTRNFYMQVFEEGEALYQLTQAAILDREATDARVIVQNWPQRRELQLFTTPISDDNGAYLGRLYVFRDVTHEREVDRMKTEFVSLVSHELRTPLTSIKGFTEMVLDGDAGEINEEVEEFLTIVYNNAERLVALVNDLLDISRIESGRIRLKLEPVALNEIVQTVTATMQQKIREKGQTLTASVEPGAVMVVGDRDKLVQVLTNYVSNAYQYSPEGASIRIEITRQGDHARVAVIDNGYGISAEDQQQLFTKFYRVDNSMTREVGGTGLGLSIVKQIIELQGGEVEVESAPGEGSTFSFTAPLAEQRAEVGEQRSEVGGQRSEVGATVTGRILIVEDDPDVARLIAHHLQRAGYEVHTAHSAEDALAHLADSLPDLITTLDINLPGMQGDELAGQLKADPATQDIPILVLSVLYDENDSVQFGAYALPKPIEQEELLATVSEMLHESRRGPVLVIDDDPGVRILLRAALEKRGFEVTTAEDGEKGLAQAREHHPGLILLDMRMPGLDGFAVLRALKDDPATAEIPVIAMTGSPDLKTTARARVLALGASDFIAKPFDMDMLVEEIRLFINDRKSEVG